MKLAPFASAVILAVCISQAGEAKSVASCKLRINSNVVTGDVKAGERLFLRCQACHTIEPSEQNRVGPNLGKIFTGKSLTAPGYKYSPAFEKAALKWTDFTKLDNFLRKPSDVVPGTKMIFAGLPKPQDRANLIAYLKNASGRGCSAK